MKPIQAMFNRLDSNRDGAVTAPEVKSYLKDAGVTPIPFVGDFMRGTLAKLAVDTVDTDGNGVISMTELRGQVQASLPAPSSTSRAALLEQARKHFLAADKDQSGTVNRAELQAAVNREFADSEDLNSLVKGVGSANGADVLMPLVDTNQDGEWSQGEMTALVDDCLGEVTEELVELEPVAIAPSPMVVEFAYASAANDGDDTNDDDDDDDWYVESVTD